MPLLSTFRAHRQTNVYKATWNLFLAQRFARHASPITTVVHTHPADEQMAERVAGLRC